ncbi:MAG: sodium:proton antiporter [bacterium]|nr:sodium:proton antiporter [bacterium]
MQPPTILIGLTAIAVLGIGAQWLAWRLHLPSILLLLLVGLIAGPGLGLLDPDKLIGRDLLFPIVSLSVAVILFEGGLTLDLSELKEMGGHLLRLVTVGVAVTWLLAALCAHYLAALDWPLAVLLGAILTVTGPTVIGPLLRHVRPSGSVGPIAKWEGIVADVIGATLAVLVFHALSEGPAEHAVSGTIWGLAKTMLVGGALGLAGALALSAPLRRHWIPDYLQSPVVLAVVLGIFTLSDHIQHESGLLAVTLIGFLLANQKRTPIKHILEFKENLRVLLISSLFIVLAARLSVADLEATSLGDVAFVLALIVIVRPAAIFLSTWRTSLTTNERLFLCCMAPRGIVAAAVSALFATGLVKHYEDAQRLTSLTFLVIIGTVACYGLAAAPIARRLGLADSNPQGALVVGGGRFGLELARALARAGVAVTLVDTNRESVRNARLAGIQSTYGSVLSEEVEHRIPMGGLGRLFALTPNDGVNSLAALHFTELFGRAEVYQLPCQTHSSEGPSELRGRDLFADHADHAFLEDKIAAGATIKATPITEEFDFDAYLAHHAGRALPILKLGENTNVTVFASATSPSVAAGETLLALVDPEDTVSPEAGAAAEETSCA